MKQHKAFSLIELLVVISAIAILATLVTNIAGCGFRKSNGTGEKIGQIVKLSHQGLFFKTWEGQIIRGGLQDGSGTMGAPFEFTVKDKTLLPAVQEALRNQTEVQITYNMPMLYSVFTTESGGVFITGIKPVVRPPQAERGSVQTQHQPEPEDPNVVVIGGVKYYKQ